MLAPPATSYIRIISVAPIVLVFSVRPFTSTVGVTAIGLPAPSKPITCVVVPVRYVSTPLPSVMIALLAVNPVLVPQAMLSLVLERVLIELVFPAMSPESVSSADLIAPEIDPIVTGKQIGRASCRERVCLYV